MRLLNKGITSLTISGLAFSHGLSDADKAKMVHGSLADFISLGAEHMVTGYDHILFLIGVIFFLTKSSDIIKFVTAFTLGHSITLLFATLFKITANYYLIDAVIALSVIYKGFENLGGFSKMFKMETTNLIMMVFLFGLIHGFGLSARLQQLALDENNLLMSILCFNLGVELGQIGVLAIIYPIILLARGKFMDIISKVSNWGLVIAGIYLLFFQLDQYFDEKHHHEEPAYQGVNQEEHHGHDKNANHSHEKEKDNDHHHGDSEHSHDDLRPHKH